MSDLAVTELLAESDGANTAQFGPARVGTDRGDPKPPVTSAVLSPLVRGVPGRTAPQI